MAERNTAEELDDVYEIKYSTDAMTGGADKRMYLYYQLADSIKKADSVDIIVSFLMESGVKMLLGELDNALKRGAKIRILTGNYLGITQPSALYLIKHKLGDQVDLRFYNEKNRSFHPKSYMFHYKGDWAKYIQPITNKLCQEYGLSIIDVEDGSKEKQHENYKDWSEYREGSFVWADMIKRDLDACILQANDFSGFLELLSEKGYEVKQGKYLAVRPQGMTRFRRCKTLGENYSQEAIVERIAKEDLSFYQSQNEEKQAVIVKCYVKRYRRAKMSGLQKRYYAKLYRIGKLKKKPYSQVWKYRDDIRKMHKLQEQYLFLVRHKIESAEELVSVLDNLTDKKKEASKEKSKTYKAKERFKDIFDKAEQIRELDDAESCYQSGDTFFEDEHNAWERLNTELLAQGYSVEEVESLRKKYESKYAQDCKAERAVSKELSLGKSIWKELTVSASAEEKQYDKETIRDRKEQPIR